MFQLVLLAAIVYILFKWLRRSAPPPRKPRVFDPPGSKVEEMAQDPSCGIWIPVSQALPLERETEILYFCSAECREKFMQGQAEKASRNS
jgi:uncharacterized protein